MALRRLSRTQYGALIVSAVLYICMLTNGFSLLNIDKKALIDLNIISTIAKVESTYQYLLSLEVVPYAIFLSIDTLFIVCFYPLLISLSNRRMILVSLFFIAGIGDVLENSFTALTLLFNHYHSAYLFIPVLATNIKFLFLLLGIMIYIFEKFGRLRKVR